MPNVLGRLVNPDDVPLTAWAAAVPEPDRDAPPIKLYYGVGAMDYGFQVVPQSNASIWIPRYHTYRGLRGHCIFKAAENKCWQIDPGNPQGRFAYWNQDGRASSPPEDWELFTFEAAGPDPDQCRIKSIYGRYVTWQAGGFVCRAAWVDASVFTVIRA